MSFLFPSQTITLEAALRDLAQGSPKARTAAAHALGDVEPTEKPRAVEALVRALDDDRPEVRAEACASLGDLGDAQVLPLLIRRLDDGAAPVRQNAAIALGTLAHPDGFEPLAQALQDGPADLRFQAATSLAEIDQARAYEPLAAALDDRDPQVVAAAALSLGAIGDGRAVPRLTAKLDHDNASTRFDVAYALAELGDAGGHDVLVAGLSDTERAWDAVTALARLASVDERSEEMRGGDPTGFAGGAGSKAPRGIDERSEEMRGGDPTGSAGGAGGKAPRGVDAAEALGRALLSKHTPPEATVLAAGSLLGMAPHSAHHDAARRVLLAALGARKLHVRGLAVEQLGEIGGSWAIAALDKLAASGKGAELADAIGTAQRAIHERVARDLRTTREGE